MNVWQTPPETENHEKGINRGMFFHAQVQTLHLIHPVLEVSFTSPSGQYLGLSPPYQGAYLLCSQENINIQEIWDYIIALFTMM